MTTNVSLDDLDAAKASEKPFEFEYINSAGDASGIFFSVLGGQSEIVRTEVARLMNDRNRRKAAREINQRIGVGAKKAEFEPFENEVEFGQRLAAIRLVGWRGISDTWSADAALRLCKSNQQVAAQVTQASDAVENFIGI